MHLLVEHQKEKLGQVELEGKIFPRQLAPLLHKLVCPALNSSALPIIHKMSVGSPSPPTQSMQKYNLPLILHEIPH